MSAAEIMARPAWVLLRAESEARGFKSVLQFRRWCRRHGVPLRTDGGRLLWVRPADVDAALEAVAAPPPPPPANDGPGQAVAHAVAVLKRGR